MCFQRAVVRCETVMPCGYSSSPSRVNERRLSAVPSNLLRVLPLQRSALVDAYERAALRNAVNESGTVECWLHLLSFVDLK